MTWRPDTIIISSGGAKGLLFVGAIKRLYEEKEFMDNIKHWVGISVGAAISLLVVIGYTVSEIIDLCIDLDLVEDILHINLEEAREKMGLLKNKTIEEKLKHCILLKYGFVPTLSQLYVLTGIQLTLVTFNIDKMRPEFLDKNCEPELLCLEAAMMSMAVPILMQPRKYRGCVYIDGAIGNSYPISTLDKENKKILGIYISSEEDLFCSDKKAISFIYRLVQASMKVIRDNEIKHASANVKHISLNTIIRDTTGIMIDRQSREYMINHGYESADSFLKINSNPEKYNSFLQENEEIPF